MAAPSGSETFVIPTARAAESIQVLLDQEIHQWFIAYLHLKRQSHLQGLRAGIRPDWTELSQILYVPGGPPGKPHLRPFWKGARKANQEWLNENLAGSYAPSSIRTVAFHVVEVDAQRRFVLKDDDAQMARHHFLGDVPVPVLPLAAFLFRDYGMYCRDLRPPDSSLIDLFCDEYGFDGVGSDEFDALFNADWGSPTPGPWLERFTPPQEAA